MNIRFTRNVDPYKFSIYLFNFQVDVFSVGPSQIVPLSVHQSDHENDIHSHDQQVPLVTHLNFV